MSFTGGKLKLKGSGPPGVSKKKKKKKSDELALVDTEAGTDAGCDSGQGGKALREGYVPPQPDESADRRTPAERKFDEIQAKREAERVAKLASKTHRDRVNEFNAYLANLSEHHDIPRVGPG